MKLETSLMSARNIDILIAVAEKGGVENCINMLGKFLTAKGHKVRIVQLVFEGTHWADASFDFNYIFDSRKGHVIQDFVDGYSSFLANSYAPDLVLATAWPMMSYVARKAKENNNMGFMIASWLHGPLQRYEKAGYGGGDFLKSADVHFAISREIAASIESACPGSVIYKVNNPISESRIHPVTERVLTNKLLFVGRLSQEKNLSLVLETISKADSRWTLDIVGDGPEKDDLIKRAKNLNIADQITFLGWSDDPWKYADGAYALIMSSLYEGFPLVAIEALSCGLPVIGNVSSKVSEIITPGENGYIYPDNDSQELSKILNMVSIGQLPLMTAEACRKSASSFRSETALFDHYVKLIATANGRILPGNTWNSKTPIIPPEKISIIVPCYNAEKYIARCLDSILTQTIGLELLEVITINDGSTDKTYDILTEYEKRYPENIGVINLSENGGQARARNIGLEYTSGEYISYVDADDCIAPDMLEKLYITAKLFPADVVDCELDMFTDHIPPVVKNNSYKLIIDTIEDEHDRKRVFLEHAFLNSPCTRLFRKDFLSNNVQIFFPEKTFMEDIYFFYMVISAAKSWCHIDYPGYYYFQNPQGTMRSSNLSKYYMNVHNVFALSVAKYKELGLFDTLKDELGIVYYKKVYCDLINYMSKMDDEKSKENKQIIKDYLESTFGDIQDNPYYEQVKNS